MSEPAEPKGRGPLPMPTSPFWTVPLILGALVFMFGVLILVQPALLAYVVAAAFCALGLSIMGLAWKMRPRSSARRGSYVEFRVDRE